jgi:hypothetical protein
MRTVFPPPRWRRRWQRRFTLRFSQGAIHIIIGHPFSSSMNRWCTAAPAGDCSGGHPAWACRRLLPSPPLDPKADHSRDVPMSLFHPSTARSERAWYSPVGLERWRSVGLPSSSNRLLSSSAPPSRSSLVCRYRPCSRPCPCRGAGHLCVMQPTSRSLLAGTPAHHLNRRRLRS